MKGVLMRAYSIQDLLVGHHYSPISPEKRFSGGVIHQAIKRDDVYLEQGYEPYSIQYGFNNWATVAVKVGDTE